MTEPSLPVTEGAGPCPSGVGAATGAAQFWTGKLFRALVIALVLALSIAIFAFRDQFTKLAAVGYAGIFLVSLVSNATIILPAPSLALVFAMGSALPPLLVGFLAGTGEALGELTGYAAGFAGRGIIENRKNYDHMAAWMRRRGDITVFVLSVVPNPFFDLAGLVAGTLRYPLWRFLLFCWMGKVIKTAFVAWAGAESLTLIAPLLR